MMQGCEIRKIKFKVWGGYFSMGGSPEDPNAMYGPYDVEKLGKEPPPAREAILQFTGLKDKNGKEIYEGDRVMWNDSYCEVEYCERRARFSLHRHVNGHMLPFDVVGGPEELEVIGNIFEHGSRWD